MELYDQALAEIRAGKFYSGCPKAEAVARAKPSFYGAHNLLGVCAINIGDFRSAETDFRKSLGLNPRYLEAQVNLGLCLLAQHRTSESRGVLERASRLAPQDPRVLYNLGKVEAADGKFDVAIRRLRAAALVSPQNPEIGLALAETLVRAGQPQAARDALQMTIQNARGSETLVRAAAVAFAADADELGEQALRTALHSDANGAGEVVRVARTAAAEKKYAVARALLRCIQWAAGSDDQWNALLGYIEYKMGNPADAARYLRRAIELAPLNEQHYLDMGEMLLFYNSDEAAIAFLKNGLERLPKSPLLHYGLAVSYWSHEKQPEVAIQELDTALGLRPDFAPALALLCQIYQGQKRWDELEQSAGRLMRADASSPLGYYYTAISQLSSPSADDRMGRAKRIQALLQTAIRLDPKFPDARLASGKLREEEGDRGAAIRELEEAVRLDPDSSEGLYRLARLYRQTGQQEKSMHALERYKHVRSQRKTDFEVLFQVVH